MQKVDTIHRYMLIWGNQWAECRLRIYEHDGRQVVVCSDAPGNGEMSVTSYAEALAAEAAQHYSLEPERLIWIEHHPQSEGIPETFDQVRFKWDGKRAAQPHWQRLQPEEVVRLTGDEGIASSSRWTNLFGTTTDVPKVS